MPRSMPSGHTSSGCPFLQVPALFRIEDDLSSHSPVCSRAGSNPHSVFVWPPLQAGERPSKEWGLMTKFASAALLTACVFFAGAPASVAHAQVGLASYYKSGQK